MSNEAIQQRLASLTQRQVSPLELTKSQPDWLFSISLLLGSAVIGVLVAVSAMLPTQGVAILWLFVFWCLGWALWGIVIGNVLYDLVHR